MEIPVEVLPTVCRPDVAHRGVTTPRMNADRFTFEWLPAQPATTRVGEGRPAEMTATTPRSCSENFTFHWLLAELAQAHDRELRQALAAPPSRHLAQGRVSSSTEGHDVNLDETPMATSPHHTQHRNNQRSVMSEVDDLLDATPAEPPQAGSMPQCNAGSGVSFASSSNARVTCHDALFSEEVQIEAHQTFTLTLTKQTTVIDEKSCMARLTSLVARDEFELSVAFMIILNVVVMCCELQYAGLDVGFNLQYPGRTESADNIWVGGEIAFDFFGWFFGCLFFLELTVKITCLRTKYWYDSESWDLKNGTPTNWKMSLARFFLSLQGFNIVDCICVLAFLFEKSAPFFTSGVKLQTVRVMRLLRLSRVVKLLRFLEALDHLYVMTTAIASLSTVLAWAITFLTIMLAICDVILVQILHITYFDNVRASDLSNGQLETHHMMYRYFGTWTRCMLSMFELTLGNWPPVARLLSEEASLWFAPVCLLHKLTIGFAVIGVITGIILQETFKVAQQDDIIMLRQHKRKTNIQRKKMEALLNTLDTARDGKLSMSEFQEIAKNPELKHWLASQHVEIDDLNTLFRLIDVDASGYITLDELFAQMPRVAGPARSVDMLRFLKRLALVE